VDLQCCAEGCTYLKNLAECTENPALRRTTAVLERLFRVPVAYIALLGRGTDVVKRIGSGQEYWPYLKELPRAHILGKPFVAKDTSECCPEGFDPHDLRFIATAPVQAEDGLQIGAILIAGREPRPDFSEADLEALAGLSSLVAAKLELRSIACHALDSELSLREAEKRFHAIANSAPVLMSYTDTNGACVFVNQAWLEFTGRSMGDELGDGWLDPVHRDHRTRIRRAFWTAFQAHRSFQDKALMRRYDGEYRWVLGQASPRFREDGSFAGMVGALTDITDARTAALE
jgi:PAS domain S-box-containing protein